MYAKYVGGRGYFHYIGYVILDMFCSEGMVSDEFSLGSRV